MLDFVSEPTLVAIFGLLGGVVLGLAARIGRFCTLGAIEDVFYGDSTVRLRMWGIAIGVAILGTFALSAAGYLDLSRTIYLSQIWSPLASVFGGLLFGYGMALAGNCGYGALARLGGGDLRSFVIVLVMGLSAYVTIGGPLAELRIWAFGARETALVTPSFATLISGWLNLPEYSVGGIIGIAILAISLSSEKIRAARKSILWGALVGAAIVSGWAGTQWVATHGFETGRIVSHTFSAPIGETMLYFMASTGSSVSFGIGSVAGVLIGAFIGSLIKGHFRWEACEDPRELRRQILGAAFMGIGAVVALGCSVGQGLSAFSVLAFSAPLTFISILIGAAIGLRQLIEGFSPAFGIGRK